MRDVTESDFTTFYNRFATMSFPRSVFGGPAFGVSDLHRSPKIVDRAKGHQKAGLNRLHEDFVDR
jgi:hypothetical protein